MPTIISANAKLFLIDFHPGLNRLTVVLTVCKHVHWKFFPPLLSLLVRTTTTFQGDWFTENLQHVVFSSPKASREGSTTTTTMREQAKRVYLRVAKYLFSSRSSSSGFLWCALFFSSNIIIPPHGKPNACIRSITQQLIPNFSLIVVSVDVSLFFLQFLLFLFPFCCCSTSFWFCFSSFCAVFRVAYFFFGAKSFTNFYSLFIRVRTTTAKSSALGLSLLPVCLILTDFRVRVWLLKEVRKIFRIKE